jgi:DNA-directed RNA polymerase specialized sigma24 family protein
MAYAHGKWLARERGPGVTENVTEEARRVFDALSELEAIPDPHLRALAISQVLADHAERAPRLREMRRKVVLELRAQGVSYRKIAAQLGVSLGAVQDIERGHSGAWGTKARKKVEPDSAAED